MRGKVYVKFLEYQRRITTGRLYIQASKPRDELLRLRRRLRRRMTMHIRKSRKKIGVEKEIQKKIGERENEEREG